MRRLTAIILALGLGALALPLIAQEDPEADKGFLLNFIEDQLSAPDRQISISAIDGVLSSDVTIPEISISDEEGVWLTIENAQLNWDQGALLTGRLQINSLKAESIDYIRPAVPAKGIDLPAPEAQAPEIPQLPIAIVLGELSVPSVTFGEDLFGLGSEIAIAGSLELIDGSLDTKLDITRKDGPGGTLALALAYARDTETADIDLKLNEPPDGLIVNLLGMEGKPEVSLSLTGSGPLSSLRTDLALDVGGKRALSGVAQLTRKDGGLGVAAELGGPIADLVPSGYKGFFGADTRLKTDLLLRDGGGMDVGSFTLTGGQLGLAARASTAADGFLQSLKLDAGIGSADGSPVALPGGDETLRLSAARLNVDYGEGDAWTAALAISGLDTGTLAAQNVTLDLGGAALNLADPANRRVTFNGDGAITGIAATDPALVKGIGTKLGLGIAGLWSPQTALKLAELRLMGKAFDMALTGTLKGTQFDGDIAVKTPNVAAFSGLAGRQLGGALDLKAKGTLDALSGGFDLVLDGSANDLALGMDAADAILSGQTTLSGRLARTASGFSAENFAIGNARSRIGANGSFSSDTADFRFELALDDLGLISDNASGALNATGTAKGTEGNIALAFDTSVPTGSLAGHNLSDGRLGFAGVLNDATLNGNLSGLAFLDGHRVDLTAGLSSADGASRLSDLRFKTQGTQLTGDVTQDASGLLTGQLALDANDLTLAGALALTELEGAATARISLAPQGDQQAAAIAARAQNLVIAGDTRIKSAEIDARIDDAFGVPAINGTLSANTIRAAGLTVATVSAKAQTQGEATAFSANATLDNGAKLAGAGSLAPAGSGYRLALDQLSLDHGSASARLVDGTSATIADDVVILQSAVFAVGTGRITSSGTAGDSLDLTIDLKSVPLSTANAILPELGLAGTLSGRARVTGAASDPQIAFDMSGAGINARAIAEFGIAPLSVSAKGGFAREMLTLSSLTASAPSGLQISAKGRLPLVGSGGDLAVGGTAPLSLANRVLASRGAQASGTVTIDARLTGSLAKPAYSGTIKMAGAEFVDPQSNLRLQSISAAARLNGETVTIESFRGSLAAGGSIGASGSVSLDADAGFPADIGISLDSARYADGNMLVATASGQLKLTGALMRSPLLAGSIWLQKAEIAIPDSFGGQSALLDVKHEDAPAGVAATLEKIEANTAGTSSSRASSSLRLDISIDAPNQVFVRGRGMDAELGGKVRLTGPVDAIQPVGGFELIRGRLIILGQRITFDSGLVSLTGNLDPYVDFTASSPGDDITVYVKVRGPVSDLDVSFSSLPELPQDEVLSQLIFKRTLGDLSPLQLAKLAAAASELAGGGGNSLTDSLRSAAGLADLDVVTDAEGNTAVRAGTYLQDNIYVGVEAGTEGKSKVTIDLDLTDTIKATGSTTSDGESSIGLFYEQDF